MDLHLPDRISAPDLDLYFRRLDLGDVDRLRVWHSDPELYRTLIGTVPTPDRAQVEEWIRVHDAAEDELNLAACTVAEDRHVGNIYLRRIDPVRRHAELAGFVGTGEDRGRGLGHTAMRLLFRYAFRVLGLHRIYSYLLEGHPMIRVHERNGFRREAVLRQHVMKDGRFRDVVVVGLLNRDYAHEVDAIVETDPPQPLRFGPGEG